MIFTKRFQILLLVRDYDNISYGTRVAFGEGEGGSLCMLYPISFADICIARFVPLGGKRGRRGRLPDIAERIEQLL